MADNTLAFYCRAVLVGYVLSRICSRKRLKIENKFQNFWYFETNGLTLYCHQINTTMRKQVMTLAWSIIKATKNNISDLSTALRLAWRRVKLVAALAAGRVQVEFAKADGEVTSRIASLIGDGGQNPLTVLFADHNDGDKIKSLRVDRLIGWTAQ